MKVNRIVWISVMLMSMSVLLLPLASAYSPGWKVMGSGWIPLSGGSQATFSFVASEYYGRGLKGKLEYVDLSAGLDVHGYVLTEMNMWDPVPPDTQNYTKAYIGGNCTVNGAKGYTFQAFADDNGEPGTNDAFGIWVYDSGGNRIYNRMPRVILGDGNIQIHYSPYRG